MSTAARQVKNIPKLYTTSVQRKHYLTVCIAEEEQLMTYKSMLFPECPSCCHQAFFKKSLPQPISAQVSSSMSNASASNRKWRCTYPVHLHVLKLEAKVITLYEVASVENLREKDLSKSLWLKEKEEKQKNFITMSTQRFQKFCDNRSYEKRKCIALKDKIFTKIPQMESIIKN